MYKNILETIEGIGIYPLFSLLIFFVFFIAIFVYVLKSDKHHLDKMSHIPLANDDEKENY